MMLYLLLFILMMPLQQLQSPTEQDLVGAWETEYPAGVKGLLIMDDDFFSITYYKKDVPEFISTKGGKWELTEDGKLALHWEFDTKNPGSVGQQPKLPLSLRSNKLTIAQEDWKQLDKGTPGALKGAWLITGRKRNGEMAGMTPGARKTMKILSGSRFQWIAYNSETGEFSGTGGGSYTTEGGKYTENIDFFSRNNSRVGASLTFDYELKDGNWHHSGQSSKGDPIYEIWSTRQSLGL